MLSESSYYYFDKKLKRYAFFNFNKIVILSLPVALYNLLLEYCNCVVNILFILFCHFLLLFHIS